MTLYWVAKGAYALLSVAFPFIIVATAFINHRVILGYFSWIKGLLKSNLAFGIVAIFMSVLAHPIVGGYLLFKAWRSRNANRAEDPYEAERKGDYINYEEVEEIDDFLDLTDVKKKKEEINKKYEDLL